MTKSIAKNNDLFTSMPVGRAVAKLAIPTVVSQIIVILYSMADTFFVGQLNDNIQMSALSITFPIYTMLTAIANLFGIGANSVMARSLGKNDEKTAKQASSYGFWASMIVTAVCCILLGVFIEPVVGIFDDDPQIISYASDYLLWVFVIGGIPTVAALMLGHLVRAVGKTKEAGIGLALGGIMNIILDPIFISVAGMGVVGAAIATMLSNVISLIFFIVVLIRLKKGSVVTLNPKQFTLKKDVSFGVVSVGFPAALSVLLVCWSIALMSKMLFGYENGEVLNSAYNVTSKCGTIALHISIGIAQGVMPLIGYSYGAKNHKRVHDVCRLSFIILLIFSIVFLIIIQLIPDLIVKLFINVDDTIEVGSAFMRCWSWCVIGMSLFNMYNSIFQAVGRWKTSLVLAVIRLGVIFTILCFVMNALWGVTGLMWVQAVTDTLSCVIAMVFYAMFKKSVMKEVRELKLNAHKEKTANRVITISRQFGSGGRTIGKEVAQKLGIPCYDSELIEKISQESGVAKEYIEKHGEYAISKSLYENAMAGRVHDGQSVFDKMWLAQKKVVIDLAKKGPCVIVGRCADYILQDIADCLKVYICASDEWRAERIVNVYGDREQSPIERLHDKDCKRKAYYELYTGTQWGVAGNYALSLDSSKLGIDGCANTIVDVYNRKSEEKQEVAINAKKAKE